MYCCHIFVRSRNKIKQSALLWVLLHTTPLKKSAPMISWFFWFFFTKIKDGRQNFVYLCLSMFHDHGKPWSFHGWKMSMFFHEMTMENHGHFMDERCPCCIHEMTMENHGHFMDERYPCFIHVSWPWTEHGKTYHG